MLAYMNILGASFQDSELLGYHVNKEHNSALTYTRDSCSAPMRSMSRLHCANEGCEINAGQANQYRYAGMVKGMERYTQ